MRERGFTLIELLVAMVIMALMSLGAFNFLSSTSRSAEHLGERQRDLLALERLQAVIASDLSQWVDRPIRDELGDWRIVLHSPYGMRVPRVTAPPHQASPGSSGNDNCG